MKRSFVLLALLGTATCASAAKLPSERYGLPPATHTHIAVPALDSAKALAEDASAEAKARPLRYAIGHKVRANPITTRGRAKLGEWRTLPDGRELWRLRVSAPNALGIELGFTRMFLPNGAELYVSDHAGKQVWGPYTDADNTPTGEFWAPSVVGEVALLELVVPAALRRHVQLELASVASAYRDIHRIATEPKSLACNVDVACPAADPFRNQVRGVAGYGFTSQGNRVLCTGQLVNNVRSDSRRLFLTANHCVPGAGTAASMVMYWRYESPTCRTPGSAASGTPIALSTAIPQTGGATQRATFGGSDFTLVELNTAIPAGVDPFFIGWDRRDVLPPSTVIIHHSNGDEKRISADNDPPVVNTTPVTIDSINLLANASFDVTYDLSTTEGGASGGALINNLGRVIGQLAGGPAGSCSTQITDTYGRLFTSWSGGGTSASRLSDWLDPDGSGAQTLDGRGLCTPPTLTLDGSATGVAGQPIAFTVNASGSGPFTVAWDVDGDGVTDRTQTNVASSASVSPSYPTASSTNVVARVTDSTGCTGQVQRAINVSGIDIVATALPLQQVCGDFDAAIEPGERWSLPVRLFNAGGKPLDGAYAIFTEGSAGGGAPGDNFGYRVLDSSNAACPFNFVDISTSAAQTLIAAGNDAGVGPEDDGHTGAIALPAPFDFYGNQVSSIVMSTNGYLSTSAGDSGGDYDNTCSLSAPDRGSSGGRFNVLHDDFVVNPGGGLRSRAFTTCPRPADSGATGACTVFQWNGISPFGGTGNAEFQAILYQGTWEIVYQYRVADVDSGADATIGIHNAAASDRLQYACNEPRANAGTAVCQFHPSALPSALAATDIRVETPAAALSDLQSGGEQTVSVNFLVPSTAQCGGTVSLDYVGTVDNVSYSMRAGNVLTTTLGGGGACNTSTCPGSPQPFVSRDGFFANPSRFGNGIGAFNIPTAGDPVFFGLWFTGQANRFPTWIAIQGDREGDQAVAPLYRFTQTSTTPFAVSSQIVGESQVTYVGPEEYVFTWVLDGVRGGEQQDSLYPRTPNPQPNRTGAWFNPGESGWGTAYDDHVLGGVPDQVGINYLYGGDGTARWTLGQSSNLDSGPMPQNTFLVHCPTCPNFRDFIDFPLGAGTLSRTFTSLTRGTVTTNIVFPAPLSGTWLRNDLPIEMLTAPVPQGP